MKLKERNAGAGTVDHMHKCPMTRRRSMTKLDSHLRDGVHKS